LPLRTSENTPSTTFVNKAKKREDRDGDAIQKLADFRTTVNTLEAQGKLAPADAQILRT
jgi:hypothetical protein